MESYLHEYLKEIALNELKKDAYNVYLEPSDPPLKRLMWKSYRPDVLGIKFMEKTNPKIILKIIECETNPDFNNIRKKTSKIKNSFSFQTKLNEKNIIHLILLIPAGKLRKINRLFLRKFWKIWLINYKGRIIYKIPIIKTF